jgi:secreted trypsin-like serine protease
MNLKCLLFIVISFLSRPTHALYGGRPLAPGKFSGVASLHLQDPENVTDKAFCAAVLIGPTKVLTAGHCIDVIGLDVYDYSLKLVNDPEVLRVKIAGVIHRVKSVTLAESYFESSDFRGEDVAVIELQEKSTATPIPVTSSKSLQVDLPVTMVAHGKSGHSVVKAVEKFSGHRLLRLDGTFTRSCAGDSGGAIIIETAGRYELAGLILSDGEGCERRDTVSIHPSLATRAL